MHQTAENQVLFAHRFDATADSVRQTVQLACAALVAVGVGDDARGTIELVLAEALNNVVEHAYAGCAQGRIDTELRRAPGQVRIEIRDQGAPLPGGALPWCPRDGLADVRQSLPEGGFGWQLLVRLTRHICYVRIDGENRLTLVIDHDWWNAPKPSPS
ncbi:ATP-binding protein [Mesobacterium sp. TK19101]|uniref:ATP-binding protein n=1 Tax=Mesobacterium hydrothermale TaxID=3111907 RepID=A0ABU6HEG4_9RHOB|nr:ATP-binding protein [Mesobacterium sp. TK19101]MEC3860854.1 ATP-binding protein [Mesobacterium sp. TK19101]